MGITIPARTLRRFWTMLSHYHGHILNYGELGRSSGVSDINVRKYYDILEGMFMVRILQPWSVNTGKRLVKHLNPDEDEYRNLTRTLSEARDRDEQSVLTECPSGDTFLGWVGGADFRLELGKVTGFTLIFDGRILDLSVFPEITDRNRDKYPSRMEKYSQRGKNRLI